MKAKRALCEGRELENMLKLSRMGVTISPSAPAFYNNPQTTDDIINHIVMRILDQFDIHLDGARRSRRRDVGGRKKT